MIGLIFKALAFYFLFVLLKNIFKGAMFVYRLKKQMNAQKENSAQQQSSEKASNSKTGKTFEAEYRVVREDSTP